MANTYTQIHLHIIFAVQNRLSLIQDSWADRLYQYITGIVQTNNHKMIIVNGMPDHLHIVIGMRPSQSLSDLMQDIKASSSKWINDNKLVKGKFQWQESYGAFSYSKSSLPKLIEYVKNQKIHHQKKTFLQEYKEFLDLFEVEYDERYIFHEIEQC
jgi:REP element-mobilizing transposase RayT